MTSLDDVRAASAAFARAAAATDPDAAVRSEIWTTAGRIVDHLGNIQHWVTEVVRTGERLDRREYRRPAEAEPVAWFRDGADELVRVLGAADPERIVPILYGAAGPTRFWPRRMAHEATKHLWDLRTATDDDPRFPVEVGPAGAADVIDEFGDVFMAEARRRGIEALAGPVALVPDDADDAWRVSPDWRLERFRHDAVAGADAPATATIRASVGDLALLLWERADLSAPDGRFRVDGDRALATTFATTPVHL
ncbi:maleylpyruvate isomerase N-terminal domain-containing protein [Agromyces sp. SYSU T0242]|uniref:maleylpyruvate isomerase N-terminal domain-containing protein n=1 Tax=Agromyces litoreus TaxID=3158561 RepID=UPI0033993F9B